MYFRAALPSDTDAIAEVWHRSYMRSHTGLVPDGLLEYRTLEKFRERVAVKVERTMVAIAGTSAGVCGADGVEVTEAAESREGISTGQVVGLVMTTQPGNTNIGPEMQTCSNCSTPVQCSEAAPQAAKATAEVLQLFVDEPFWGQGVAHRLLKMAEERIVSESSAKEGDSFIAELFVISGNSRAARFYEKHGWQLSQPEPVEYHAEVVLASGEFTTYRLICLQYVKDMLLMEV